MNVAGFEDAFRGAQVVRLRVVPNLEVRIATPAGLALLKLIAWRERYPAGVKDAGDLDFLVRNYLDVGNRERLAEEHPDWLTQEDFDYEQAGARLLGRDMADIMLTRTLELVLEILGEETRESGRYRLVEDMLKPHDRDGAEAEVCRALLAALLTGLKESG
jgi:predicted nucleotidyltransferase